MKDNEETKKSVQAEREEKILTFWQKESMFQKSLLKDAPKGNYVFYDGPPFATGLPHYGHVLGSTAKDVVGRYKTMQGYHVPRRWGWDCHGLPIENIVEKTLGISGRKEIEAYGIENFTETARSKVLTYVGEWKKTVDRIGRWVDFDNGYKTMDNTFIESVWWALSELNKKGLVYEGVRVLAYCPRCETPIANSEIAMDNSYKDITDISAYVKFALVDEPKTYLIAWTTTPWTLPGNVALAINPEFDYVKIKIEEATYILAKERLSVIKPAYEIVGEVKGSELVGKKYEPVFDYYMHDENIAGEKAPSSGKKTWTVVAADFVTLDAGTGVVHIAPAFGEDDMNLAKKENLPWIIHVTPTGKFKDEISHFPGQYVKPKDNHQAGDIEIIKYLAHNHHLFEKEKIIHSYPHCHRCDTPLYYYALPSWFVNIQKIKSDLIDHAKEMNWVPAHLKNGRFGAILESAPDWTISRNRYWASPLPIWKNQKGELLFVGSLTELLEKTKKSGNTYFVMRHGETDGNLKNLVSDEITEPSELTEGGKKVVAESAAKLKTETDLDYIIYSPFARTKNTAMEVAEAFGLSGNALIEDARLGEMYLGKTFNGKTWDDFHAAFPKKIEYYRKAPEGGESYCDLRKRMLSFIFDIESKYKGKKILIVTHGGPAWSLETGVNRLAPDACFDILTKAEHYRYYKNAEYKKIDFVPFPHTADYDLDFHRPYIDAVTLVDENDEEYTRIPEVIDCWFESGSMPFAQDHHPFDRPNWIKENFPAGFVAEYIAQTRTWFYYSHVISTVLFGHAPFEHIVTTGTLQAEDGQKMSKSKNNFPDPWILFDKYGVDALRLYLMSSPLMKGEDANFSEKSVDDISKKLIGRLYNVLTFYELYRDMSVESAAAPASNNVLDAWIMSRLNQLVTDITRGMEAYDIVEATRPFDLFIDDLSTWYLRRSRERIKNNEKEAKATLYFAMRILAQLLAPFAPFTAEDIWQKLKNDSGANPDAESVHLSEWPVADVVNDVVLSDMERTRAIVEKALAARQENKIPVRQPLSKLSISENLPADYFDVMKEELNIKEIVVDESLPKGEVVLETEITPELRAEGVVRELMRAIQDMRKAAGLTPSDVITLTIESDEQGTQLIETFADDIQKTVLAERINFGANYGEEVKVGDLVFKVKIEK
ncbi:MAG: class I tRNA ligase family protein [Candidatus Pacebacteria bacterium]|nr:class I tRNA ligase family protein [Candidatus Paceibacterota bacterium]